MASDSHPVLLAAAAIFVAAACSSEPSTSADAGAFDASVDGGTPRDMREVFDLAEMYEEQGVADTSSEVDAYVPDSGDGDVADLADVDTEDMSEEADVGPDMPACTPSGPPDVWTALPTMLSATGLYDDIAAGTIAPGVRSFSPQFPLWSDGALKTRWVYLPECATIDTADPDHWSMPVGTSFWKQFDVSGVRVETRWIHRFGPGPEDFLFGVYLWSEDQTDATLVPSGAVDALGTTHDVPNIQACEACHGRLPERILGFGTIQLAHQDSDVTLDDLVQEGVIPQPAPVTVPGTALEQQALGYLHGNCGNCHNATAGAIQLPRTALNLRLSASDASVDMTGTYRTAVDVDIDRFSHPGCDKRVAPGSPDTSCLILRMQTRGRVEQMPPIGTEISDPDGLQLITDWVNSLQP